MLIRRRSFLVALAGACAGSLPIASLVQAIDQERLTKPFGEQGDALPVIGMGTWINFNVGDDQQALDVRAEILRAFFEAGGGMIDSSPM